jgi:hypothetical protein
MSDLLVSLYSNLNTASGLVLNLVRLKNPTVFDKVKGLAGIKKFLSRNIET